MKGLNLNWLKSYDTNCKYFHFKPSHKFDAPPYSHSTALEIHDCGNVTLAIYYHELNARSIRRSPLAKMASKEAKRNVL